MTTAVDFTIGAKLPELALPGISRTTLALFAGGSGDHNPIHIDVDYARTAGMPDVFAHGMLSMAYLGRLVTNWVPQRQIRSLSARFVSITPVGAAPVCSGVITAVDEHNGERVATIELEVRLGDGTLTLTGEAVVAIADGTSPSS